MCSACEGKAPEPHEAADPATVRRAREIESRMPGERVPEACWDVFFGFAGGSVEYRHYQRIHEAYTQAESSRVRLQRGMRRAAAPAGYSVAV